MEKIYNYIRNKKIFIIFSWSVRALLFLAFLPSGLIKVLGERFTTLGTDTTIGFFFEGLYKSGFYWIFLGFMQLLAGILLLIPRTTFLALVIYFPIIVNIFVIVTSMGFKGTPVVAGLMLLANIYLFFWDYKKLKQIVSIIFE